MRWLWRVLAIYLFCEFTAAYAHSIHGWPLVLSVPVAAMSLAFVIVTLARWARGEDE